MKLPYKFLLGTGVARLTTPKSNFCYTVPSVLRVPRPLPTLSPVCIIYLLTSKPSMQLLKLSAIFGFAGFSYGYFGYNTEAIPRLLRIHPLTSVPERLQLDSDLPTRENGRR